MKRNKGLVITIGTFMILFMISVVYAAASGSLTIGGSVTYMPQADVDLIIVDADFASSTPGNVNDPGNVKDESVEVPGIIDGGDSHTMYIAVDLLYPGDKRIVEFSIENIEAVSAKLGTLQVNDPDILETGVKITWPNLDGVVVLSGQKSGPYQIEIEWDINNYSPSNTGQHVFSATISYKQGT